MSDVTEPTDGRAGAEAEPIRPSDPATSGTTPNPPDRVGAAATAVADAVAAAVSSAVAEAIETAVARSASPSPPPARTSEPDASGAKATGRDAPGAQATGADASGAGAAERAASGTEATDGGAGAKPLLVAYARYLALFVGAGLLAGAVVHFPLAPLRYAAMGVAGAVLFAAGSLRERLGERTPAARATSIGASLVVALGVGMVAGGIQHFEDVPSRSAVLIPAGLLIGLAAFAVREGHRLARQHLLPLAAGALLLTGALGAALSTLAPTASAVGGHGHGAAAEAPAEERPAAAGPASDGHAGGEAKAPAAKPAHADEAHAEAAHGKPRPAAAAHDDEHGHADPKAHTPKPEAGADDEPVSRYGPTHEEGPEAEEDEAVSRYASPSAGEH